MKNTIVAITLLTNLFMSFDDVFNFENLYRSANKCCNGVRWKASTQNYETYLVKNVTETLKQLQNGTYKSKGFNSFTIKERGKERQIQAVHISERVVQKCLCDYCLYPALEKSFIYDSGATLKGKGLSFSVNRIKTHLHRYYRKYGNEGYVLVFDIKSFFPSINHQKLIDIAKPYFDDERLFNLYSYFVNCFKDDVGLGLGSQISQLSALLYLNGLDHTIKDVLRVKFYGRYMDDGYIISHDKEELVKLRGIIEQELTKLGLRLNTHKTQIIKLNKGFTILKRRFILKSTGKLVVKPLKANITRYKRKYKKLLAKGVSETDLKMLTTNFIGYLKQFHYKDNYTKPLRRKICTG